LGYDVGILAIHDDDCLLIFTYALVDITERSLAVPIASILPCLETLVNLGPKVVDIILAQNDPEGELNEEDL
jgi:hypothetical protein